VNAGFDLALALLTIGSKKPSKPAAQSPINDVRQLQVDRSPSEEAASLETAKEFMKLDPYNLFAPARVAERPEFAVEPQRDIIFGNSDARRLKTPASPKPLGCPSELLRCCGGTRGGFVLQESTKGVEEVFPALPEEHTEEVVLGRQPRASLGVSSTPIQKTPGSGDSLRESADVFMR
jgi:hypothetical protein